MSAEIKVIRTAAETALLERFSALKDDLPGTGELARRREEAFELVESAGLPHRRVEDWKYTDLRAVMREAAPPADRLTAAESEAALGGAKAFARIDAVRFAFINGHLSVAHSDLTKLAAPIEIVSLADALAAGHPLLAAMGRVAVAKSNVALALNAAFMADGAVIRVPRNVTVETPLHLRFVNAGHTPFATAPRVLVVVEEGASLTLIESHEGPAGIAYQPNSVVEMVVAADARVSHIRLNAEGGEALVLSTLAVTMGAGAQLDMLNVVTGGALSRHQVFLAFAGEGARATLNGATMVKGRQHADTTLVVDHAVPGCASRELYRAVIDDEATGVFQGKIIVRPHAQKTDGRMMSAALLLSEQGTMNNKPELEIFADDVQCAHGATCGALDDDLLFYLMARGLPRAEAEALMVQAFLGEVIEMAGHDGARAALTKIAVDWLRLRARKHSQARPGSSRASKS